MKLLRYGSVGSERPGIVDSSGVVRDLSAVVNDITGATISPESLQRLRAVKRPDELQMLRLASEKVIAASSMVATMVTA